MQRFVIHKVGVGSLGRLYGTWVSIVAFFAGLVGSVVTTVNVFANNSYSILAGIGVAVAIVFGYIIVLPIIGYVFGWLQGAVLAIVFNYVVTGSGGVSVHLEETNLDASPIAKK